MQRAGAQSILTSFYRPLIVGMSQMANLGRRLNKWINHQHTAIADKGCAATWPAPCMLHYRTKGWSLPPPSQPDPLADQAGILGLPRLTATIGL
jgi:hypothetical protein